MLEDMGKKARTAARSLAQASNEVKNAALLSLADSLQTEQPAVLQANCLDVDAAVQSGLSPALVDRLGSAAGGPKKEPASREFDPVAERLFAFLIEGAMPFTPPADAPPQKQP